MRRANGEVHFMRGNSGVSHLVVFALDDGQYGLTLSTVERVVRAVDITSLPKAPDIFCGVINVQGRIVPVVNVRRRFHLPEREVALNDQFIIARTSRRSVALISDRVTDVLGYAEGEVVPPDSILPGLEYIAGVVKLADGMALIHDLDRFLSLDEERALDEAMAHA
jgi:purine-binding chemotaxis protein CheW